MFYVSSLSPFSDNSPDSPKLATKLVRNSPRSGSVQMRKMAALTGPTSPNRPSSLPVCSPSSSPSQPIPVPSQVRAYEQIQRSMGGSPSSPPSARVCSSPKVSRGAFRVCVGYVGQGSMLFLCVVCVAQGSILCCVFLHRSREHFVFAFCLWIKGAFCFGFLFI